MGGFRPYEETEVGEERPVGITRCKGVQDGWVDMGFAVPEGADTAGKGIEVGPLFGGDLAIEYLQMGRELVEDCVYERRNVPIYETW